MHPALRLENLSRLPTSVQVIATTAVDGSVEDLLQLLSLMTRGRNTHEQFMPCLPVFYANLDLAQIPGETYLRSSRSLPTATAKAIISLKALRVLEKYPQDTGPDLWPRVWGWLSHLHKYRRFLPRGPTEMEICNDLLSFIWRMGSGSNTLSLQLIRKTVGARALVTRAWRLMFQVRGKKPDSQSLSALIWIFHRFLQIDEFLNWEETVEGAGGTEADLAKLIARFIDFFIPTARTVLTMNVLVYMDAVFCPLMALGQSERAMTAFVAGGLITSLTNVICVFSASNIVQTEDILGAALQILCCIFGRREPQRSIRDAVVAGILRAMVSYGIRGVEVEYSTKLLTNILPLSTMSFTVVAKLETAFRDVDDLVVHSAFAKSAIFEAWTSFRTLAEERIAVAKVWNSPQGAPRKACDNMECGNIHQKSDFKCCGYCHEVYYCSRRCQRVDWKRDHREQCSSIRKYTLKHPEFLSPRDISFMRALLHHDYETRKQEILRLQIAFIREQPSSPIVTIFDYASGRPRISVETIYVASAMMTNYIGVNCAARAAEGRRGVAVNTLRSLSPVRCAAAAGWNYI